MNDDLPDGEINQPSENPENAEQTDRRHVLKVGTNLALKAGAALIPVLITLRGRSALATGKVFSAYEPGGPHGYHQVFYQLGPNGEHRPYP